MESKESLESGRSIGRIRLCPDKEATITRPRTDKEGLLGIVADLRYFSNPGSAEAMAESMTFQTMCDSAGCRGPIKVPRKILGIKIGKKIICSRDYEGPFEPVEVPERRQRRRRH